MIPSEDAEPTRGASIGHYRVEERLGAGGMGAVYRGYDENLHRSVALKRLLPAAPGGTLALRFRREARMAARLNHPAIVHIYEIVESGDAEWIVMELVQGKTLDRLLREGRLEVSPAVRWAREIAEGLSEAHAQGVVHRDLKAANVMVTPAGRVKILDFGLAKMYGEDVDQEISAPGAVVGTCHAMSPEQAQGLAVDHRSDLFSLGSLLYEMLTGVSPFQAETPTQTLARICAHEPTPIRDVAPSLPDELAAIVHRLLQKPVDQRVQSAEEVVAALERIERAGSLDAGPPASFVTRIDTGRARPSAPRAGVTGPSPMSSLERRQITVLCFESVGLAHGASGSSRGVDAEALFEQMLQLRPLGEAAAVRYGGTPGSAIGNRLLLYFGYPVAHEDDAWRAVRAGLDLVAGIDGHLADAPAGGPLALRVALHTGTAVVSSSRHAPESVVLGPMLDVVLRLLASAEPGTVVMSSGTRALVHRGVAIEACPPLPPAPGSTESLRSFLVREGHDSGDERLYDGVPLVGRDRELDLLLARWDQARGGTGQAVLVSGEPGMGKSRLLRAVRERLQVAHGGAPRWVAAHGSPYTQSTPLYLGLQLLQRVTTAAPGATVADQLAAALAALSLSEALPLLAALLDLPADVRPPLPPMPPERQREQTLDALVALVLAMAEREPLVVLVEDLHWCDATSIAWLDRLIEHASTAALLLVMTVRSNAANVSWSGRAQITQLALAPLGPEDTACFVQLLSGGRALPADVRRHILDRTDGVPLFIEELTRSVLEGGESGEWRALPTSLRDSLTVRLDRLGRAREVAQLASVIGRTFSLSLLAAISVHDGDTLERELRRLVQSGLVFRRGFGAQARYSFKHALVRDAAYDSLLKRERQHLHLRVAHALETQRDAGEGVPSELLAHHFAEGNRPDLSAAHRLDAARQALARSAYDEALEHTRAGLDTIGAMPQGAPRDGLELQLQSARLPAVIATEGFASPQVERAYLRGLDLCGEDEGRFGLLYGLYSFYAVRAAPAAALPHAERMQAIAESLDSAALRVQSHYALGALCFLQGDLASARRHLAVAAAQTDPDLDAALPQAFGTDDRKPALAYDALAGWMQGRGDEALALGDAAVAAARSGGQPFTLTTVLLLTGFLHRCRRDAAALRRHAEELLALADAHGLFQVRDANVLLGLALATDSDDDVAGRAHLRRSLEAYRATGFRVFVGFYQVEFASACLRHDAVDEADAALQDAWAALAAGAEGFWEPELHRVQGELHARRGQDAAADAAYSTALSLAAERGAIGLELRAATSLARLRQASARDRLASALARLPQDTATADRLEAEALLAALG